MGKACGNTVDRVLASKTGISAPIKFSRHLDVSHGGVLLSLPSLSASGLLRHSSTFKPDEGYYSVESVFICLAFLFLLRAKTLAQSSNIPSGELGKVLGLDRIPEVKTLRKRIERFCDRTDVKQWSAALSKDWMKQHPELSGVLYVDGHVKIYYGKKTKMPKRYVSRQRLCMSGSTDYWVNDMTGQPFFVINEVINSGMLDKFKTEIIPRLNQDVPNQPSEEELKSKPLLSRYMVVFDRECYSPDFFHQLWYKERIAICTYRKYVTEKWPEEEFSTYEMKLISGEIQKVELAERGVLLKSSGSKKQIWCREIRKKTKSGHQTSIITTNYSMEIVTIGIYMFARWSQENFFKYMMENFEIDTLISYTKEIVDETKKLINPVYRALESELKKLNGKMIRRKAEFATYTLAENKIEENNMHKYLTRKANVLDEIEQLENNIKEVKNKKKNTEKKICFGQLPENEKFTNAINEKKHFIDTIKMIAYRAETAMCNIMKPKMGHTDESRKLIKQIYKSDVDIKPDYDNKTLNISLHKLNYWKDDKILEKLCEELNQTKTIFPGTDLTLFYKLVSSKNP